MEEYINNNEENEEPGVEEISLQDFSYTKIRRENPQLDSISKREYLNNKELQEEVQGIRLGGTTWLDDFKFEDDLTIGQELSIEYDQQKETNPIDESINTFADGGYIDPPKKATRQDSLNVYNNSRKVENYYKKEKYKDSEASFFQSIVNDGEIHERNDKTFEIFSADRPIIRNASFKQKVLGITKKEYGNKIDKNKYQQRELAIGVLNMGSPMQLFDRRIQPRSGKVYTKDGDYVEIASYNSIANKPFDLLTEAEKKKRVEVYGTEGVPKSYYQNKKDTKEDTKKEIRQEVKKEIKKENKPLPKVSPINKLDPEGILVDDEISSNVKIIPSRRTPKSFKVIETEASPYGLDNRKEGNNITTYEVENIDNISTRKLNGKREIQAQYADGGFIDPPIKGKGLNTQQQTEAEADALWFNNWTANRVVGGAKLKHGYQIPSSQVVQSGDLTSYGETGRYDPKTKEITLDPTSTEQGVPAHEYSHRYQDYTKLTRPKTYNDYINMPITEIISNQGTYDTDPNEIHSELMRLRRNSNFKPDQVISNEDIDNVDTTLYNLKNIDKDSLIKLLNSTAYNSSNNNQNVAAYGGNVSKNNNSELITFDNGGTHQENRLGGIPMGKGANGKMNTVEEGETKYDFKDGGYIFSNRINTKGLFRDM